MGLDITTSNKSYHSGYGGIHALRYVSYRVCGGKKDFVGWMGRQNANGYDFEYFQSLARFPNLNWHSDSNGGYTLNGKVEPFYAPKELLTGNTTELFKELKTLKRLGKKYFDARTDGIFKQFYAVVKDALKNDNGIIKFH